MYKVKRAKEKRLQRAGASCVQGGEKGEPELVNQRLRGDEIGKRNIFGLPAICTCLEKCTNTQTRTQANADTETYI